MVFECEPRRQSGKGLKLFQKPVDSIRIAQTDEPLGSEGEPNVPLYEASELARNSPHSNAGTYARHRRQVGRCTPGSRDADEVHSVCLVTSPGTARWMVPKGKLNTADDPWTCAERECFEEAGVLGYAAQTPITMLRVLPSGLLETPLYLLDVLFVLDDWPNCEIRKRIWKPPAGAAAMVDDPEVMVVLKTLSRSFPKT
jgi:8-oxo-dGTP pyrophosphatase MutT (NUDIX family)